MVALAAMQGRPLDPGDVEGARAFYAAAAPASLVLPAQAAAVDSSLALRALGFTPPGMPRVPAVGDVRAVRLSNPARDDVLVADLRLDVVGFFAPWMAERRWVELGRGLGGAVAATPCDLDGDGRLDLAVAGIGGMNPTNERLGQVTLLRQRSRQVLTPEVAVRGLCRPTSVRPADLDQDGDLDLVVSGFGWISAGELVVLEQVAARPDGPLMWRPHVIDSRDGFVDAVPADLDGDGRLDLVAALGQEHEQVVVFRARGALSFEPARAIDRGPHPAWGTSGLQVVDMDRDGDLDVLVANGDSLDDLTPKPWHGVAWLEQREGGFARQPVGLVLGCERAVASDLDQDGDLDVVAVSFLPYLEPAAQAGLDSVVWFERRPDGAFVRRSLEKGACHHGALSVMDVDGDALPDVVVGNFAWMVDDDVPLRELDWLTLFTRRP